MQRILLRPSFNHTVKKVWSGESNKILKENLIYPLFLSDKRNCFEEVPGFPNQYKLGQDKLLSYLEPIVSNGLKSVLLFGSICDEHKDNLGTSADSDNNPVIKALPIIRKAFPHLLLITDVCLCAYTSHGACALLDGSGEIDNNKSIERLAQISLSYAQNGASVVAPSDMLDNRILSIHEILCKYGLRESTSIMSYAAKFSSSFYGPFRHAANSSFSSTSKRENQLPVGSLGLALKAIKRDIKEGSDFVIVKPGLTSLDIIKTAHGEISEGTPIVAYQVSGEYLMLHCAAKSGGLNLGEALLETMTCFKRAGCSAVVSYFTPEILALLKDQN